MHQRTLTQSTRGSAEVLAIGLLALAATTTNAQSWETIASVVGQSSKAIMVDPSPAAGNWPNLVVTVEIPGQNSLNGTPYKVWRLSQTDVPSPEDPDLSPLNASGAIVYSMTSDTAGNLYWAGALNATNGYKWIVRGSGDGGSSWSELLRWPLDSAGFARARGATADDADRLFVCGLATDAAGFCHWIVQSSGDQGATWSTSDVFKASATGVAAYAFINRVEAAGTVFVPGSSGGVYVVGARDNVWTVTRSVDGGLTWTIVDSWVPARGQLTHALKVASDAAGRIFVLGGNGNTDSPAWVIRMSDDHGAHWRTIFGPWTAPGGLQRPNDLTLDANGRLWIAGIVYSSVKTGKTTTWTSMPTVVGLQEGATGSWSGTKYSLGPGTTGTTIYHDAGANGITADQLGHVYVSGTYLTQTATTPVVHWFVQRLLP